MKKESLKGKESCEKAIHRPGRKDSSPPGCPTQILWLLEHCKPKGWLSQTQAHGCCRIGLSLEGAPPDGEEQKLRTCCGGVQWCMCSVRWPLGAVCSAP